MTGKQLSTGLFCKTTPFHSQSIPSRSRDFPPEGSFEELQAQLFIPLAELRKHNGDEVIPLRVHVTEGGG